MFGLILMLLGLLIFYNKNKILDYQENIAGRNNQAFRREAREVSIVVFSISSLISGIIMVILNF
ncbi:MAG: hypothetical protein ACM339_07010 [Ignavibacteria bacterium]